MLSILNYTHYYIFDLSPLLLSLLLFLIGFLGIIYNTKNIIISLMSIELMLLSLVLNFVTLSIYFDDFRGQLMALFIITIAASESALGLSLLIRLYRLRNTIALTKINLLQG